jgi:hypothetical protein
MYILKIPCDDELTGAISKKKDLFRSIVIYFGHGHGARDGMFCARGANIVWVPFITHHVATDLGIPSGLSELNVHSLEHALRRGGRALNVSSCTDHAVNTRTGDGRR